MIRSQWAHPFLNVPKISKAEKPLGTGSLTEWLPAVEKAKVVLLPFWICDSTAKRYDLPTDKKAMNENKVSLKEQLKLLFGNKAALLLSSAGLIIMIATSASNAVNMYYMSYNSNRMDLVAIFGLLTTLVSLLHLKKRKLK